MRLSIALFAIAACLLTGCDKSKSSTVSAPAAGVTSSSDDPVQKKLQELAGSRATNCGLLKSQVPAEMQVVSKCALDAAKSKTPFYVEYALPGMNVALAGNAQGKLYSVQTQEGSAGIVSVDCPAELRVAPSGRVTCYAPGTFPMGAAGSGSHPSMVVPPFMGTGSAHGSGGVMPAGHPAVQPNPKAQPPTQ
jgi:hypothetical protein